VTAFWYSYRRVWKRSGSRRLLAIPAPWLARVQRRLLRRVLEPLVVRGKSALSYALPHVGKALVIRLDLADFFPSVARAHVEDAFLAVGCSATTARLFTIYTTDPEHGGVPQGACTSSVLAEFAARGIDARVSSLLGPHGFTFSRYADDMTISSGRKIDRADVASIVGEVARLVKLEGFTLNMKKTRSSPATTRQVVAGIVVNERASLPRAEVRKMRAAVDQQATLTDREYEALCGKLANLAHVDPEKAAPLLARLLPRPSRW